jgi:hypothetical protein
MLDIRYLKAVRSCRSLNPLQRHPVVNLRNIHTPINLRPELNPSAQRFLMRFFTTDFASLTVNFVNVCVQNQQMQKLLYIYCNNYVGATVHN